MSLESEITVFHPDRPGIRKVLGNLEAEIMEVIWTLPAEQGTTVRTVFERLYQQRHIAYTTVMSTMTRLAKKRLLAVEKQGQGYVYRPTVTEQEFVTHFVNRILEELFVSFAEPTLAGIKTLSDQHSAAHAHHLLQEIAHRRSQEEAE
jgi:predicted transcriptional regulator